MPRRHIILSSAAGLAISATASAQLEVVNNRPGAFIPGVNDPANFVAGSDADDAIVPVTIPAGFDNEVLASGAYVADTNGRVGGFPGSVFTNAALTAASTVGYYPMWEDLLLTAGAGGGATNGIYAATVNNVFVIEWDGGVFNAASSGTPGPTGLRMQLQVFPTGNPIRAQFLYQGLGTMTGQSATIGVVAAGPAPVQYGFNTPGLISDATILSVVPLVTGACCLGDGTCATLSAAQCAAQGGAYRGDNSPCATANCPSGACCLGNGTCIVGALAGCSARSGVYRGDGSACGTANCTPGVFTPVPLTLNFNGMVHGSPEQGAGNFANNATGYRSVADRGLLLDGLVGAINAGPVTDPDFIPFTLVSQPNVLDIICLGDRRTVANAARNWGTGTNNALQPDWLPNSDLTGPQVSPLAPMNAVFGPNTCLGVLYQVSDGGGRFDMTLTFTDNSFATVTLRAPDWFGDHTPPLPTAGSGLAAQRKLGVYTGTANTDLAAPGNVLNVAEAVVNVASLQAAGLGSFAGKQLASITFSNPISNTTTYANSTPATASGMAIIGATLGNLAGGPVCYANCDNSTTPPILNVSDFSCFLNMFAAGDPYANCDGSTTPPVLNVSDFACFLNRFAAGCS